jgi:hypothetical protein
MVELMQMALPATILRDGQTVTIRPLDDQDREALFAFGHRLPRDELLYVEDDFLSPELIARLINARFAENWRQLIAEADGEILGIARRASCPAGRTTSPTSGCSSAHSGAAAALARCWRRRSSMPLAS